MHHGQDRYAVTNMSCCIASHYPWAVECGRGIHLVVVFVRIGLFNIVQLLDINEANSCVANWSLVLSQLPLLYQLCSNTHLRQVAEFILQALLLAVRKEEDESQEETTPCVRVAVSVLKSEGFASMRRLQELLLETIFVHAASSIPKW